MAFIYNSTNTYEDNFQRWWQAKKLEAEMHKIHLYTEEVAREKFDYYFKNKKIKITRIKKS
jgi:hypothetical protein